MPALNFTKDDIKSGFLVKTPGRYNYQCIAVSNKPSKTDGSPNYTMRWKGLDKEMEGVVVFVTLSSKAGWLWTPIFAAANGGNPLVEGQDYNPDDLKDIRLSAMTTRGTNQNGGFQNQLSDWMPATI